MPFLFCFGLGYTARCLARSLRAEGWRVGGTCRAGEENGCDGTVFEREHPLDPAILKEVTHILVSIPPDSGPPDSGGDPALDRHAADIAAIPGLAWLGYLSTTGVYGDTGGDWVDETSPVRPQVPRSIRRAEAERRWQSLWHEQGVPVHVFRLAGIYGPGRSAIDSVRANRAHRVIKPGQMFCRIHVDDLARVLRASIAKPNPGAVYNVCDDDPAPPQDVIVHACALLGVPPPPELSWDEALRTLSPMALSFFNDNRRVRNDRIKRELGVVLKYPTYREGLGAVILDQGLTPPPPAAHPPPDTETR